MLISIILIDNDCIAYWFLSIGHAGYINLYSVEGERGYRQCSINENNDTDIYSNKHNYVSNSNWREADHFIDAAEKLNSGLPRTTSAGGQNGI